MRATVSKHCKPRQEIPDGSSWSTVPPQRHSAQPSFFLWGNDRGLQTCSKYSRHRSSLSSSPNGHQTQNSLSSPHSCIRAARGLLSAGSQTYTKHTCRCCPVISLHCHANLAQFCARATSRRSGHLSSRSPPRCLVR